MAPTGQAPWRSYPEKIAETPRDARSKLAPQMGNMTLIYTSDAVCLCMQSGWPFATRMNFHLSLSDADFGSQSGALMRIAGLFSFFLLIAAALPAQAKELPEHTVLAFNLPACPKGWVEYAAATGKLPGLLFCEKALGRR